ncbi:hypothetical protein [Terrabacter carboxydivorans]|uniref:Transposase n=1 Tax=Terrabacter carboxydivorans TaxID=619730 RepID=A0ABN3MF14_9MICO
MTVEEGPVVIGMDPHKRSVTIEVMKADETVLGGGRFATDVEGFAAMLADARRWPERTSAVECCNGIGGHVANRLIAVGEHVVDVPPKLSARAGCSRRHTVAVRRGASALPHFVIRPLAA